MLKLLRRRYHQVARWVCVLLASFWTGTAFAAPVEFVSSLQAGVMAVIFGFGYVSQSWYASSCRPGKSCGWCDPGQEQK